MGDSPGSTWQLNVADTISFSLILVAIEEIGRSLVPDGGPTLPWAWKLVFLVIGIAFSYLGRKGRQIWRWVGRKGIHEENIRLRTEMEELKKKISRVPVSLAPGAPHNGVEIIWNATRMVPEAQDRARREKISFAEAVTRDPRYQDLRRFLQDSVIGQIERGLVQPLPTDVAVDPLYGLLSNEISRIHDTWTVERIIPSPPQLDEETIQKLKQQWLEERVAQEQVQDRLKKLTTPEDTLVNGLSETEYRLYIAMKSDLTNLHWSQKIALKRVCTVGKMGLYDIQGGLEADGLTNAEWIIGDLVRRDFLESKNGMVSPPVAKAKWIEVIFQGLKLC